MSDLLLSLVPGHLERRLWDAPRLAVHRRDALRATLAHAMEHSPFYARRFAGLDVSRFDESDIARLPVLTKDEMMASFDEFVTDRRIRRSDLDRHLDEIGEEPRLFLDEYLVLASGGSSGVRGIFLFGRRAAADYVLGGVRSSIAARMAAAAAKPGERQLTATVSAASAVHATRGLPALFAGPMLEVVSVPATLPIPAIVRQLEELQPTALHGYPTVLALLADEKAAGRLSIAPATVTTSSEPLTEELRERIERGFGVGAVDQFGCSEGMIGASDPGSPAIAMPADLVILELVDDAGDPVPPGTESSRVLLTTLYNPVQPLVRYELTDRMTLVDTGAADGHPRVRVSGRSDDLLRFGPTVVHPHALRSVMVHTSAVREYQIRQTATGIDLLVVTSAPVDAADLADRMRTALLQAGVRGADVAVHAVESIPRDERTAKARRIVPWSGPRAEASRS